jgi:hypothetical protein
MPTPPKSKPIPKPRAIATAKNVGKDLSVIKWSEAAYGAYEWPEQYFR